MFEFLVANQMDSFLTFQKFLKPVQNSTIGKARQMWCTSNKISYFSVFLFNMSLVQSVCTLFLLLLVIPSRVHSLYWVLRPFKIASLISGQANQIGGLKAEYLQESFCLVAIREENYESHHEKTCFSHMQTTKVQISLCICAVWSAPLLFATLIV